MTKAYYHVENWDTLLKNFLNEYAVNKEPISVNFRELVFSITKTDRYTHFIHSYPAKLLQHIPYLFLNNTILSQEKDIVLDPFCGTGTVLLEASLANRNAIGIDVNPLATLISKAKTTRLDIQKLKNELANIEAKFEIHQKSNKKYYVPKISNIEKWYTKQTIRKLSKIKYIVSNISNPEIKDFFLVVFSLCCKKFSLADPRISVPVAINTSKFKQHSSLHKAAIDNLKFIKKNEIYKFFISQANKNIQRLEEFINIPQEYGNVQIINTDIKYLDPSLIKQESVQLILTSPPYVSAQKYIRASSLSLQWLELNKLSIKELDKQSVGREHFTKTMYEEIHLLGFKNIDAILTRIYKKNKLRAYITYTYLQEMQQSFQIFYNLLKNNGYFVMVIGNNTIAGLEFYTHQYLREIAEKIGFSTELILIDDIKSRGLMTKRNKTASMISREYIIIFRK